MIPFNESTHPVDRRSFCKRLAGVASVYGLGWVAAADAHLIPSQEEKSITHKFQTPADMTLEQVYRFAFQNNYIPVMTVLAEQIGREKFLKQLKEAASEGTMRRLQDRASRIPNRDLATFANLLAGNSRSRNVLTLEVVEQTDRIFEIRVTECLWAKIFLEAGAGDIGYAGICHADYAVAQVFNPKLTMVRDKTLMEGMDCCNHRYIMQT